MRLLKKFIIYILMFIPVSKGFKVSRAQAYFEEIYKDFFHNKKYTMAYKLRSYRKGFLPEKAERFDIFKNEYDEYISDYEYNYIYPINDIFSKWLEDEITTRKVLKPFKEYLPKYFYQLYMRDMIPFIIKLDDCPDKYNEEFCSILELIKDKGTVSLHDKTGDVQIEIKYIKDKFYFNEEKISAEMLIEKIKSEIKNKAIIITDYIKRSNSVKIIAYNKYGDNMIVGQSYACSDKYGRCYYTTVNPYDGTVEKSWYISEENKIINEERFITVYGSKIPYWEEIKNTIKAIGEFIPQIEIMEIEVVVHNNGFVFTSFDAHPEHPTAIPFNHEMVEYFKSKVDQKKKLSKHKEQKKTNLLKIIDSFFWTCMSKIFCPPEMSPIIYKWWYITAREDLFSHNGISLKNKLWAYKKGFLSYRIEQYGITKENYSNFISDFDYRYLRHINNEYRSWLEDKITIKYICSDYSDFFPKYYYHFSVRNGKKRLIPLMDLPDYCTNKLESIFKLVEKEGKLACKPQKGSQGKGFYKFSYSNGKYYLNYDEVTKEQVLNILNDGESQYIITEYIEQHELINNIYSGSVNTLRIITYKKDGKTPKIGNAYMRFGSIKTGAVDNMGAGGMFAQIDMDTGKFYNGKMITENNIVPCEYHPDTGILIEGILPNWETIKKGVLNLSNEMPQLEYLGYDVAITENGMKIPEINRAPGYPKIEKFSSETIEYLLYKRKIKMKKYGLKRIKG